MTEEIKEYIDGQYSLLKRYKHNANKQILYNIIYAKHKYGIDDYKQSLYLDIKKFVQSYITAADNEDYGYDEIQLSKIEEVVKLLEVKQRLSILCLVRRLFVMRGYDTDDLSFIITKTEISASFAAHSWFRGIRIWLGASLLRVTLVYLFYVIVLCLVLLPAPYRWMGLFEVTMNQYCSNFFFNHIANVLGLISGSDDISPTIIPANFVGMVVFSLSKLLFYLIFINYILKKMEEYLTVK